MDSPEPPETFSASEPQRLFGDYRERVDAALDAIMPPDSEPPAGLHAAMRYSVFAGGKRLRPILLLTAGEACGASVDDLLPAACAVELIHTYSLIHDDLPAFDDDDLRRGKATNHKVFGEAQAILAGDALQSLAFCSMAEAARTADDPAPWVESIVELGAAIGSIGMAGGQWLDVEAEGDDLDLIALETLHAAKTGALLTACVRIGAILGGVDAAGLDRLSAYGRAVGLAFQVIDDILDVEGSVESLGKTPGGDAHRRKPTYPTMLGLDEARATAERLRAVAHSSIEPLGEAAKSLRVIADFIIARSQ